VFLIAGATRYSFLKFLLADLIYVIFGVGLLFFFGAGIVNLIKRFESTALVVGAVLVVGYGLFLYFRWLRRRELARSGTAPVSVVQGMAGTPAEGEPAKDPAAAPAAESQAKAALKGK
jgi:hypothetical protein